MAFYFSFDCEKRSAVSHDWFSNTLIARYVATTRFIVCLKFTAIWLKNVKSIVAAALAFNACRRTDNEAHGSARDVSLYCERSSRGIAWALQRCLWVMFVGFHPPC